MLGRATHTVQTNEGEATLTVRGECPITHERWTLVVDANGYEAWRKGELIQRALSELSADEREMLKTGTTQKGWDQMFGGSGE